jgi:hypothetical protein
MKVDGPTLIDFRSKVRIATAAVALVLGWFAIATIRAESFTAKRRIFFPRQHQSKQSATQL